MVTIEYTPTTSKITGEVLPAEVTTSLSNNMAYEVPNAEHTDAYLRGWDGMKRLYRVKSRTFPSGMLYMVEGILKKHGVEYELEGYDFPEVLGDYDPETGGLRDYQINGVLDALEAGRGVVHFPTGSGKSLILVGIMSIVGRLGLIVVHRKELMNQMKDHLENAGFKVGVIQGKQKLMWHHKREWDCDVYVAMSTTLCAAYSRKHDDPSRIAFESLADTIECLCIDEVQRAGADKYYKMVMRFDAPYRFGVSATIKGRSDGADMLLHALTGDVVARVAETELIEEGWISKPRIFMFDVEARHRSKHDWHEIYTEAIVNNRERNELVADAVAALIAADKQVLVLCQQIKHGHILKEIINDAVNEYFKGNSPFPEIDFIHGSTPDGIREGGINKLRRHDAMGLILSTIGDEGLDIPDVDAIINCSGGKSAIKALQRLGRGLRKKDSGECWYIDFVDNDGGGRSMLRRHSQYRWEAYESREFEVNFVGFDEFIQELFEIRGDEAF